MKDFVWQGRSHFICICEFQAEALNRKARKEHPQRTRRKSAQPLHIFTA